MKLWRACCVASLGLLAAACGETPPPGWARADIGLASRIFDTCPDLTGTYRLDPPDFADNRIVMGRSGASVNGRVFPWETITFEGDAGKSIVITLARGKNRSSQIWGWLESSRKTPAHGILAVTREYAGDPELALTFKRGQFGWPTRRMVLTHDRDYACEGGWLKGRASEARQPPVGFMLEPGQVLGIQWWARDTAGNLLARVDYQERGSLSFCEQCQSYALGDAHGVAWGRWATSEPAWQGEAFLPWPGVD